MRLVCPGTNFYSSDSRLPSETCPKMPALNGNCQKVVDISLNMKYCWKVVLL